jgi:hypothetical protein
MSIAEKLQVIAENQQLVYQAGYDKGVAEGLNSGGSAVVGDDFIVNVAAPPNTIKTYSDTWTGGIPAYAFQGYTELETVYAPKAEIIASYAFAGCSKLTSVEVGSKIPFESFGEAMEGAGCVYIGYNAFQYCVSIRKCKLYYGSGDTACCNSEVFLGCSNLESVDFHSFAGELGGCLFKECPSLYAIVFRNDEWRFTQTPDLIYDAFQDSNVASGTCYIYVASKYLSEYQTDWPQYANQFRALEDYTVDGTITGELDETKI